MTLSLYAMTGTPLCSRSVAALPVDRREIDAFLNHFVERRELAQALDRADHVFDRDTHLFLGREPSESESDRAVRELVADAHRAQHVARLQARGGAGRSGRHGYV